MAFADTYFARFKTGASFIKHPPAEDLFLSVVIPACREPELLATLASLKECTAAPGSVEIIVIVNHAEDAPPETRAMNHKSYEAALDFAEKNSCPKLQFHIRLENQFPKKFAGVGLARKTGMDEALRRFNYLNKPEGIITGLDADSTVRSDYFTAIAKHFDTLPHSPACSIRFEHPLSTEKYAPEIIRAITHYELHLRYFVECLRRIDFPYAYHTIGSAFAVRAQMYAAQGGMNRKKAGEDFYFLQKIIPQGNFSELNETVVYPSPRMSDRVPFGTGAAVGKILHETSGDYLTYHFDAFQTLADLFFQIKILYTSTSLSALHPALETFMLKDHFHEAVNQLRNNVGNFEMFRNRFFRYFNAFKVIKFLNFAHNGYFEKINVEKAGELLWQKMYPEKTVIPDIREQLLSLRKRQNNR